MSASSRPVLTPLADQAQRQVHRRRRLADAAFAGRHGDDVLHARHVDAAAATGGLGSGPARGPFAVAVPVTARRRRRRLRCCALGRHDGCGRQHTRHGAHHLLARLAQRLQRGAPRRVDFEGHGNVTATGGDAAHHAQGHDIAPAGGVDHCLENAAHGRFAYFRHVRWLPLARGLGNILSPLDCWYGCRHIYAARRESKVPRRRLR